MAAAPVREACVARSCWLLLTTCSGTESPDWVEEDIPLGGAPPSSCLRPQRAAGCQASDTHDVHAGAGLVS